MLMHGHESVGEVYGLCWRGKTRFHKKTFFGAFHVFLELLLGCLHQLFYHIPYLIHYFKHYSVNSIIYNGNPYFIRSAMDNLRRGRS